MKAMHSMSAKKALHAMFLQQRARMPCIVPKSQPLKTEDGHEPYAQAHTFPFLGAGSRIAAGTPPTYTLCPVTCTSITCSWKGFHACMFPQTCAHPAA